MWGVNEESLRSLFGAYLYLDLLDELGLTVCILEMNIDLLEVFWLVRFSRYMPVQRFVCDQITHSHRATRTKEEKPHLILCSIRTRINQVQKFNVCNYPICMHVIHIYIYTYSYILLVIGTCSVNLHTPHIPGRWTERVDVPGCA